MNIKKDSIIAGIMFLVALSIFVPAACHAKRIHREQVAEQNILLAQKVLEDQKHAMVLHHKDQIHQICEALRTHNGLPDTTVHGLAHEIEVLEAIDAE